MPFQDKRNGTWGVKVRVNGRQVRRTVNHKNLAKVGIDLPETYEITESVARDFEHFSEEINKED